MELNVSSPKPGGLSASDFVSDPEEKEVSDDDDDDRNHKHRRRDARSQSLERDTLDQDITRPYRKRNKPFVNGHSFRDNDSQASTPSKYYNSTSFENFSGKFDKRRPGSASLPRAPFDLNQRMRANQAFPGDLGPGRGRGRDSASWSQRDSRFSSDITSQLVQQGSLPPSMFGGRGLPNVSNPQNASWNAFGLLPGVPNGGLDTLHSIGLQGTLRPPIRSSLNLGIPRQRCRDFEERGFCLRGDMCPMEHGVNRIVVEDVQSLSQFNLPVSLPSAHLLGKPTGPGPLPSVSASSTTLMNNKGLHSKASKSSVTDDTSLGGTDLYDPDQPLWNNNGPETSNAILGLQSPRNDETDSLSNDDPSDRHQARLCDNADNEYPIRTVGTAAGSQSTSVSVWGRIGSSKNRPDVKEKIDPTINYSDNPENVTESQINIHQQHQGKRSIAEDTNSKTLNSLAKRPYDTMRTVRKPSQKALRTLFVNGIPQKSNRREALVSHFQKFGEILDIHIPSNSERAFVQFSKREEAEAALKAPDAVMGNRFIKLWWANRDSIPEDGPGKASMVSESSPGLTAVSVPLHSSGSSFSKDNQQSSSKGSIVHASDASVPSFDNSKPVISNGPKAPPLQKKLENLEQLKEELRKKQEMLDQKRNDFRRQLYKLEKQGGPKGEADTELAAKRRKVGLAADADKVATPSSSSPTPTPVSALADEMLTDKNQSGDTVVSHSPKASTAMTLQQSPTLKHQMIRPSVPLGTPVPLNRYKLDNRPTGFRILPPLPSGFANVTVIKEHFVPCGDISNVELEDLESRDSSSELDISKKCSARITFATRRSAEKAFLNGKCWEGCDLKFVWLTSSNSSNGGEKSPSTTPRAALSADIQPADKLASTTSQDTSASGDAESEQSERKDGDEHMKLGEPSMPSSSPTSWVKESSKGDAT
ncbi:PREDICTED: zinc finger CCCH domain-containing protein 41 [Fragaria vesca subsp. vesca]|uniref:zinc finger CCCH domain-containing protein 41 n=1 Tax=Fragaria vesca subsp. vesca TaxID=101020 RepID=UPI0002C30B9F|nr:PREDICTED: zinc finger CCCH domain-containing protein 41 [Fragaria vesca subsp. vesca]